MKEKESGQADADPPSPLAYHAQYHRKLLEGIHNQRNTRIQNTLTFIDMGQGDLSSSMAPASPIKPPPFKTNTTVKKEYRDSVRICIATMNLLARAGAKYKAHVSVECRLVHMACDGIAKAILKKDEKKQTLTLGTL